MKGKKEKSKRRITTAVNCGILLLFFMAVAVTFGVQNQKLDDRFDQVTCENLQAMTRGQRRQIHGIIADAENTMMSMAAMIEETKLPPEGEWLSNSLKTMNDANEMFEIEYRSEEQLRQAAESEAASDSSREAYGKLLAGENAISDPSLFFVSEGSGQAESFFAGVPVKKDGRTVGALQVRIEAAVLTMPIQTSGIFQRTSSLIIKGDGTILCSDTSGYENTGNLFDSMKKQKLTEGSAEEMRRRTAEEDSFICQFFGKGKKYFGSVEKVGYNDWYIVTFVRSPDVLLQSETILKSMVSMGIALIGITACAGAVLIWVMLRQRRRLNLEQQRYAALAEFSDTVLFEYTKASDTVEFTSNARKKLEIKQLKTPDVFAAGRTTELVHPEDIRVMKRVLDGAGKESSEGLLYAEARLKGIDGEYRWFGCQYKTIRNKRGELLRVLGKLSDITDQRGREQDLAELARRDILTDTYNKAGEVIINGLLAEKKKGIFFMIDLDNFKQINDTYGHAAGDEFLGQTGTVLKGVFRKEDIIARVGGDEFVVFISDLADRRIAEKKARAITKKIGEIAAGGVRPGCCSASAGVSFAPEAGVTYVELYAAADKAMYEAKQKGKGGYILHQ